MSGRTKAQKLELFLERVKTLSTWELITENEARNSLTFNIEEYEVSSVTVTHLPKDRFVAYLTTFRKFISPREDAYLPKICDIAIGVIADGALKDSLIKCKSDFEKINSSSPLGLIISGEQITVKDVMNLWLSGEHFHDDFDKRGRLQRMDPLDSDLSRFAFEASVMSLSHVIVDASHLIRAGFRDGLFHFDALPR